MCIRPPTAIAMLSYPPLFAYGPDGPNPGKQQSKVCKNKTVIAVNTPILYSQVR